MAFILFHFGYVNLCQFSNYCLKSSCFQDLTYHLDIPDCTRNTPKTEKPA